MDEMLDLVRTELKPANSYFDEVTGGYVRVDDELRDAMFARFQVLHDTVRSQQYEVRARYLIVGACLAEIQRDRLYNVVKMQYGIIGYGGFYEFCESVFGFKKTTVKNLIAVYNEFCSQDGLLRIDYMNYSYSQLVELSGMDRYRERIPVTCSVRNIKRLKELYREYAPRAGTTYEDDLQEWRRRHELALSEENAEKNKISFIPARNTVMEGGTSAQLANGQTSDRLKNVDSECNFVTKTGGQTSDRIENPTDTGNSSASDEETVEDEREISTPDVALELSFEQIRDGLLRQLDLLHNVIGWKSASDVVMNALRDNRPISIARTVDVIRIMQEKDALVRENEELKRSGSALEKPAGGEPLNLRNKNERDLWLRNFRSWGVWLEVPELSVKYYRYEFRNGAALTVTVGLEYWDAWTAHPSEAKEKTVYAIQDEEHEKFSISGVSKTYVLEWLSKHWKEL